MSNIFNIDAGKGRFNKTQVKVLKALRAATKPMSMRDLEEKLEIKRLTILYNLKQLQQLELVRQDRTGRIYTWLLVPPEVRAGSTEIPIERAYEVLARSPSQKLWGIQGGEAVRMLTEKILKGMTYKPIHHRQRLRQIIIDGILTPKGVGYIKRVPEKELSSHLHRPTILHITADTPELDNLEIISDAKVLLIIDRAAGNATVIRDPYAVTAYLALHETIKATSTKMRPQEIYGDIG
ncbi:MAG: helix-turn-helix transcriptional regulator [Parcubacteria group bacterium]|nr:helix-turn-helix transcriptional regulator [Parcubacteria group bacterium]